MASSLYTYEDALMDSRLFDDQDREALSRELSHLPLCPARQMSVRVRSGRASDGVIGGNLCCLCLPFSEVLAPVSVCILDGCGGTGLTLCYIFAIFLFLFLSSTPSPVFIVYHSGRLVGLLINTDTPVLQLPCGHSVCQGCHDARILHPTQQQCPVDRCMGPPLPVAETQPAVSRSGQPNPASPFHGADALGFRPSLKASSSPWLESYDVDYSRGSGVSPISTGSCKTLEVERLVNTWLAQAPHDKIIGKCAR